MKQVSEVVNMKFKLQLSKHMCDEDEKLKYEKLGFKFKLHYSGISFSSNFNGHPISYFVPKNSPKIKLKTAEDIAELSKEYGPLKISDDNVITIN